MTLLQESLERLQRRFEAAGETHGELCCIMAERPAARESTDELPALRPIDEASAVGFVPYLAPSATAGGRSREYRLHGPTDACRAFVRLAREAGRLIPDCRCTALADATLALPERSAGERWLWALFDLAWSPEPGSPLRAVRSAWHGNVSIDFETLEVLRRALRIATWQPDPLLPLLAKISSPPDSFYSTLDDVFAASCAAVDRLLVAEALALPPDDDADRKSASRARRSNRTAADKLRDEGMIAAHLVDHPDATRDDVASAISIARAHVSQSRAWRAHSAARKEATRANRARGRG
jgi:hypothetical protein